MGKLSGKVQPTYMMNILNVSPGSMIQEPTLFSFISMKNPTHAIAISSENHRMFSYSQSNNKGFLRE